MIELDDFHNMVGETIFNCQRIENDIKYIYAGMLKGDFAVNKYEIKKETLGTILIALEELDNSDGHPYLSRDEYKLLKNITRMRNWLVHQAYTDFIYSSDDDIENEFNNCCTKLREFNRKMVTLGDQVEQVRLNVLEYYGRI